MPFLSEVVNRTVLDPDGTPIGSVKDFLIQAEAPYPPIQAMVFKRGRAIHIVPWRQIVSISPKAAILRQPLASLEEISEEPDTLWLVRDVLDKQIVDTQGVRLVRVNDIALVPLNDELRVGGIDKSTTGILRQLMPGWFNLGNQRGQIIDWEQVDLGSAVDVIRLRAPFGKLARMRPADIASVISQMSPGEAADVLETLDEDTAALALAELHEEHQASVLSAMDPEEAADVLEEMEPEDAADALGEISEERARELMELMEPDAASEVRSLMAYPEDTAGGLMSPGFVAVTPEMTVHETLDRVRESDLMDEETVSIFVVDESQRLIGWVSLADLLSATDGARAGDVMQEIKDSVLPEDSWERAGRRMLRYRLLSIPVVDVDGRLKGVVTLNTIAEWLTPRSWQNVPRRIL